MEEDPEEIKYRRRNRKPLAYCKWMTDRPGLWFGLTLGGHVLFLVLNMILLVVGYDILPFEFNAFPVDIKKELSFKRQYAWHSRDNDSEKLNRFTIDDISPWWPRGYGDDINLYYTAGGKGRNVFTKENLVQIKEIEDYLVTTKNFSSFCQLEETLSCKKPTSILRYFDGTYVNISDTFYDPNFDNIPKVLLTAHNHSETRDDFLYFLGYGYSLTPTEAFSNVTRTTFHMGYPLEGSGSEDEQENKKDNYYRDIFIPALKEAADKPRGGLSMYFYGWTLFGVDIIPFVIKDMMLAVGSLCFIMVFILVQTGSFWISGWAVFSIITCFFITNLIYRTIINYSFLGYFHCIAIFIILGIGADDIFVYYNTWKATAFEQYPSLAHRLSDTYRRAAGTMFFTSFTTMMAFLIGGISPVLPLGSFGIFTGVLVAVNYVSVIVFFPNVVLMYTTYFEKQCCLNCVCPHERPGCCACCHNQDSNNQSKPSDFPGSPPYVIKDELQTNKNGISDVPVCSKKKKSPVVRFFAGPYFRFVTHKVVRWIIIVVFLAFVGFFIWSATHIEASTESVQIFKDTTNYGKAQDLDTNAFVSNDQNNVGMHMVWGLEPMDFTECHFTDWKCQGTKEYDNVFDMNIAPAQTALSNLCDKLKYGLTPEQQEQLKIQNNSKTGQLEVDCFLDNLQQYMLNEQYNIETAHNVSLNLSYPLTQTNMEAFMKYHPDIYEPDKLGREFYHYFEIGTSIWINNGYTMLTHPDYLTYNELVGEAQNPPHTLPVKYHNELMNGTVHGSYGTKLRYISIRVNLTLNEHALGHAQGLPIFDRWEQFFKDEVSSMPATLHQGFPTTDWVWHWLIVQQALENGAWFGIGISIAIACLVLILATMNIIVGLLATSLIGCVTAGVIGVIPLAGWKIDVMISMNLTLLVGLSVDYIVHIAEGYHLSEHKHRLDRVRDMLENLGISILNGAVTTLGAAFFMLFSKIQFFFQFGTFLFCIIGFSMAFSLLFFPAVMSLIGPEYDTGSIITPFKKLHYKVIGRKKEDINCPDCKGKGFRKQTESHDQNVIKPLLSNGIGNGFLHNEQLTMPNANTETNIDDSNIKHEINEVVYIEDSATDNMALNNLSLASTDKDDTGLIFVNDNEPDSMERNGPYTESDAQLDESDVPVHVINHNTSENHTYTYCVTDPTELTVVHL